MTLVLNAVRKHGLTTSAPLHVAPQMAHVSMTFFLPALPSSRLPQSVQKMREPIADMVNGLVVSCRVELSKSNATGRKKSGNFAGSTAALPHLQR